MREFAGMHVLDVWYARIDGKGLLDLLAAAKVKLQAKPLDMPTSRALIRSTTC